MKEYDSPAGEACPHCGYDPGTPPEKSNYLTPGTIIGGRYIIGKGLGSGGFGITYIAHDNLMNLTVCIKEYLPEMLAYRVQEKNSIACYTKENESKFKAGALKMVEESNCLARCNSLESVVSVYNCVEDNDTVYIVMEYLEGKTLSEILKARGKYTFDEALEIITPILRSLSRVHGEGILHRDISPDNIFLCDDGRVKLIDFGAARTAFGYDEKTLAVILKPGYAPVEQYYSTAVQGSPTDVYGTAATLYYMITAVVPQESLFRAKDDALVPPSQLGTELPDYAERAIMRALEMDYDKRTRSAGAFLNQLTNPDAVPDSFAVKIQEGEEEEKQEPPKSSRRSLILGIGIGLAIAAILAVIIFLVTGGKQITDQGTCGDSLTYTLTAKGEMQISGIGRMYDYLYAEDTPWHSQRKKIKTLHVGEGVETIGNNAFSGCPALEEISFCSTITEIGSASFKNCSSLDKTVIINNGATSIGSDAFAGCKSLNFLHIPVTVTRFGTNITDGDTRICSGSSACDAAQYAGNNGISFTNCGTVHSALEAATGSDFDPEVFTELPSVTTITATGQCGSSVNWQLNSSGVLTLSGTGDISAYSYDCTADRWVSFPDWTPYADEVRSVTVESGITSVGAFTFANLTLLRSITLPEGIVSIGEGAFFNCKALSQIELPSSVKSIGSKAFSNCYSLALADLSACSAKEIAASMFENSNSLRVVKMPLSAARIGERAFCGCSALEVISLPSGIKSVGSYAFSGCSSLTGIEFPSGINELSDYVFAGSGLVSFRVPGGVEMIGNYAFSNCKSLSSVTVSSSVEAIGECAFSNCSSITGIILPSGVETIGRFAFSNCTKLKYVHMSSGVKNIGEGVLDGSGAYICSDRRFTYASSYAAKNGISFKACGGSH